MAEEFIEGNEERRSVRLHPRTPLDDLREAVMAARVAQYTVTEIEQVVSDACAEEPNFVNNGKPHFNQPL